MEKEIFDTLPYIARKELVDLRHDMAKAFEENAHIIHDVPSEDVLYQFRDFTEQYAFVVRFAHFDDTKKKNVYVVYQCPASTTRLKGESYPRTLPEIAEVFKKWIDLIEMMHQITNEFFDPFKNFYDQEFSDFFVNDDADAAINPFELEKQEVLYYFLTYAEKTISNSIDIDEESKGELLKEVSQLKQEIPTLTKKRFVAALSKLAQKTKKISNRVFHEVFDVLKKEAIKKLLYEGMDQIPNIAHQIHHWIG